MNILKERVELMKPIDKFTGKADVYAKYRPSYPAAYVDYLIEASGVTSTSVIADIGSGTGIWTKHLLERGLHVNAVEPNADMRQLAEASLDHYPGFTSVDGSAEQSSLSAHSIDLITVAQAFHWFHPERFQAECKRVLRSDAKVALLWNSRDHRSELVQADAELCQRYCPAFKGFSGGIQEKPEVFEQFFRNGQYEYREFAHPITMELEGFIGRHLSASYSLTPVDEQYEAYIDAITELFKQHSNGNQLILPNVTRSYIGIV